MTERKIHHYDWEIERVDTLGVLEYVLHEYPLLKDYQVPVKAYPTVSHGIDPEYVVEMIEADNLRNGLKEFRQKVFKEKDWVTWQTGIGGVFFKDGTPKFFVPMIDFEFISTEDVKADIQKIEEPLRLLGVSGSIIRSGDPGMGSYFFIGHDPFPYNPNYWHFMGKILTSFAVGEGEEAKLTRDFGNQLLNANTRGESVEIAKSILEAFPSIKTGLERPGILCDARYLGHKIIDGFVNLRETPGKSYNDRPLEVAAYS
jgi:hypothetical protein